MNSKLTTEEKLDVLLKQGQAKETPWREIVMSIIGGALIPIIWAAITLYFRVGAIEGNYVTENDLNNFRFTVERVFDNTEHNFIEVRNEIEHLHPESKIELRSLTLMKTRSGSSSPLMGLKQIPKPYEQFNCIVTQHNYEFKKRAP